MGNNSKPDLQYTKRIALLIRIIFFMNSNSNCCSGKVYGICKNNHKRSYLHIFKIVLVIEYFYQSVF